MYCLKKISLLRYFLFSLLVLITITFLIEMSEKELFFLGVTYLGVVTSQVFLICGIYYIIGATQRDIKYSKFKTFFFLFGKSTLLLFIFYQGVHFVGDRIIIPLLLYIFQLIVLIASIKRT